jgi:hypothetical protein
MTEFTELDLAKDPDDMDAEEAKATLGEFMDAHKQNRDAYDSVQSELQETEAEYKEQLEAKDEKLAEFREKRAQEAAEHVEMPASLLADRFSIDEIEQIIGEAEESAEYSEEPEGDDEEEADDKLTTFSEKPAKGRQESSGGSSYSRDRAEEKIKGHW